MLWSKLKTLDRVGDVIKNSEYLGGDNRIPLARDRF